LAAKRRQKAKIATKRSKLDSKAAFLLNTKLKRNRTLGRPSTNRIIVWISCLTTSQKCSGSKPSRKTELLRQSTTERLTRIEAKTIQISKLPS